MTPVPGLPGKVGVGVAGNLATSSMAMPVSNFEARPLSVRVLMDPSTPSGGVGRDGRIGRDSRIGRGDSREREKTQGSTVGRTRRRSQR